MKAIIELICKSIVMLVAIITSGIISIAALYLTFFPVTIPVTLLILWFLTY